MDINYELYKVFYYVARTLSFSEAATELFISQSAVSQSIKVLEKRLNQTLFTRSTKRVSLTKEGEMLFKHIEPAVSLITRGENTLINSKASGGMQLRIAASDTICRYFLVPYLNTFHQKFPDVHIRIINGTSLKCAELLETNQVDLVITNSPNPAITNSMNIMTLKTFHDVFIANRQAFDIDDKIFTLEELSAMPILMLSKLSTTSAFLHNIFLQHSLDLVPAVELSSNDLLIDFARIGLGVAFVPDFCLDFTDNDILGTIRLSIPLPERKLVAAYDVAVPLTQTASNFLEIIEADNKASGL